MQNLNNDAYECLLGDLIHDAFYTDVSNRGKIMLMRAYAEVIVRKILLIPVGEEMTLGKKFVREKISGINNTLLTNAVNNIRDMGNASTHTQDTSVKTETEVATVIDSLFDLLAYLFIRFFEEYSFGSNPSIMTAFSLQPPIIRYKVLDYLFEKEPDNILAIWKLPLVLLKIKSQAEAIAWIELHKDRLIHLVPIANGQRLVCKSNTGKDLLFDNMYDLCIYNVNAVSEDTERVIYQNFESALPHYKEHGRLSGNTQDEIEFNSIMEFLYLGRKENTAT